MLLVAPEYTIDKRKRRWILRRYRFEGIVPVLGKGKRSVPSEDLFINAYPIFVPSGKITRVVITDGKDISVLPFEEIRADRMGRIIDSFNKEGKKVRRRSPVENDVTFTVEVPLELTLLDVLNAIDPESFLVSIWDEEYQSAEGSYVIVPSPKGGYRYYANGVYRLEKGEILDVFPSLRGKRNRRFLVIGNMEDFHFFPPDLEYEMVFRYTNTENDLLPEMFEDVFGSLEDPPQGNKGVLPLFRFPADNIDAIRERIREETKRKRSFYAYPTIADSKGNVYVFGRDIVPTIFKYEGEEDVPVTIYVADCSATTFIVFILVHEEGDILPLLEKVASILKKMKEEYLKRYRYPLGIVDHREVLRDVSRGIKDLEEGIPPGVLLWFSI